jgi:hypothetical protein
MILMDDEAVKLQHLMLECASHRSAGACVPNSIGRGPGMKLRSMMTHRLGSRSLLLVGDVEL